ncbi:MAG: type II toxin-antitoxin system RelE/ParE family toxin [Methanobacteriota archaeon]|nr:MAG: type II toxin-antitoxin system RelE/ParE family toxin [Euryarchaeota archaeon]
MRVKFSKQAIGFLEKCPSKQKERVRSKINFLVSALEKHGIIPFRELDIRKMSGSWEGFFRMRSGKTRVVFRIDKKNDILWIYLIDSRGDIYKKR